MANPKSAAAGSHATQSLATVAPHEALLNLQQERRWLLKQIRRKRTELDNFISQMRDIASEIFERSSDALNAMKALDVEIHGLFDEIFTKRKLGKRSRRQVEQVYRNLMMRGIISANPDVMNGGDFGSPDDAEADFFSNDSDADTFRDFATGEDGPGFGEKSSAGEDAPPDSSSRDRAFRQTFLRLASIYHPDRAEDADTHARNTEIMKEINRAYKSGDFARLLELEQQEEQNDIEDALSAEDDLERECKRLERENDKLNDQYEGIKQELRNLRNNTQEGVMVKTYRRAAKEGVDLVEELVDEAVEDVEMVEEIRDFVRDFRDRKITIQEFVDGPGPKSPEEMIAALEEMLGVSVSFDPDMFR
ncbi:MAG: J domain-containing protein [Elainellaceae cyanobacterium]